VVVAQPGSPGFVLIASGGPLIAVCGACIRFKRAEDLPLALIGEAIQRMSTERFVAAYEDNLPHAIKKKRAR
jgi:hypothetical protein